MPELAPLLADVTQTRVAGLLQHRQDVEILDTDDVEQVARFQDRVRGAAVEVVLLTGSDPTPGPVRDLALEAIACQTASGIEYALFPEQQAPDRDGRGYYLHQWYLELLAHLGDPTGAGSGSTAGSFVGSYSYPSGSGCW